MKVKTIISGILVLVIGGVLLNHEHQNVAAMQRQLIAGETMFTSLGNPISNSTD